MFLLNIQMLMEIKKILKKIFLFKILESFCQKHFIKEMSPDEDI